MAAHSGDAEAQPGAGEACIGAMEAHFGAVKGLLTMQCGIFESLN